MENNLEIVETVRRILGLTQISAISEQLTALNKNLEDIKNLLLAQRPSQITEITKEITTPVAMPKFRYVFEDTTTPRSIPPLGKINILAPITGSGLLYNALVLVQDSNAFKITISVDGIDYSITPDELIMYETSYIDNNNDWSWVFISSPPGPPFGMRFKSVNGLEFITQLSIAIENTSSDSAITLGGYRIFAKVYI